MFHGHNFFEHVFIRHKHMINQEYFSQNLETFLEFIPSYFKEPFSEKLVMISISFAMFYVIFWNIKYNVFEIIILHNQILQDNIITEIYISKLVSLNSMSCINN